MCVFSKCTSEHCICMSYDLWYMQQEPWIQRFSTDKRSTLPMTTTYIQVQSKIELQWRHNTHQINGARLCIYNRSLVFHVYLAHLFMNTHNIQSHKLNTSSVTHWCISITTPLEEAIGISRLALYDIVWVVFDGSRVYFSHVLLAAGKPKPIDILRCDWLCLWSLWSLDWTEYNNWKQ